MKTFKILFLFLILGSTYAFPSQIVKEWCVPYPLNDENISSISITSIDEGYGCVSTEFTYKEHKFRLDLYYSNGTGMNPETYVYGFIQILCDTHNHPYVNYDYCSYEQFSTQTQSFSGSSCSTLVRGTITKNYTPGYHYSQKVQALIYYDLQNNTFRIDMYDYEWEPETT
ncbi:MAG: hypothetical protein Q4F97_08090 [Bacteroidales bacterium]|nr:hypothetical protein [Bacteroidales bacterium]